VPSITNYAGNRQISALLFLQKVSIRSGFFYFRDAFQKLRHNYCDKTILLFWRENHMNKLKFFLQIVSIFVVSLATSQHAQAQNRADRLLINEAKRVSKDDFPVSIDTPKGARIYSVSQPSSNMLDAIDKGLTELFAVARKNNYSKRLNYSDYTIFIARADRTKDSSNQYSPDIAVPLGQYAGSVYDQGGFVYAAGMVLTFNPCAFVIAEHTKDLQRVSNVVRYEGEHLILYHNDRARYNKTFDHSQGGAHPIMQ
jgi:hypothetical protein